MKKIYFYFVIVPLILTSCNSSGSRKEPKSDVIVPSEIIDTAKQEQPFSQNKVFRTNPIKRDTTINNCHISYVIQDNHDIIKTFPIIDGKGLDTVYYAGREIILDIKYLENNILCKKIDRDFFNSYIPKEEIEKYSIYYFNLDRVDNSEKIFFSLSLCMPESDICYWFELSVSNKGDIEIKDTTSDDDEDM